jgi:hypothetical protein
VIDTADFPACFTALAHIPRDRIIVIGPEPDPAYRKVAMSNGAGGWLPRDDVGSTLSSEVRRLLGCRHDPCPPGLHAHDRTSDRPAVTAARFGCHS